MQVLSSLPLGRKVTAVDCLLYDRYQVGDVPFWTKVTGTLTHIHSVEIGTLPIKAGQGDWIAPQNELGARFDSQLREYLLRIRNTFDLPLWDHGDSDTQRAAMDFLRLIPCGQTRSYSDQAEYVRDRCGGGFGPRNAGTANHGNHYPLVIPCHRVVRKSGNLGGFMGSSQQLAITLKRQLLANEQLKLVQRAVVQ